MKFERAMLLLAVLVMALCVFEINRLHRRLDEVARPAPSPGAAGAAATNFAGRLSRLERLTPTPGLFMMAIQHHFAKLYYAGEARNWELAAFERGEIMENLETVITLVPEDHGVNLAGIADAFKNTPMQSLKDAIAVKDRGLFREAYRDCMVVCNACHQATGRPFIMITTPTNPPVANQIWEIPSAPAK